MHVTRPSLLIESQMVCARGESIGCSCLCLWAVDTINILLVVGCPPGLSALAELLAHGYSDRSMSTHHPWAVFGFSV
eukprot:COSAG01_NODE_13065_length_1641_cov_50.255512_2_plen_77_part_00